MKIGKKLKELKTLKKLKLKEIALETGLSVSYLSDIMNERSNPSVDTLIRLSDFMGVPASSFIGEDTAAYLNEAETELNELLSDYSQWPKRDQEDLLEYIQAKKKVILLRRKEE